MTKRVKDKVIAHVRRNGKNIASMAYLVGVSQRHMYRELKLDPIFRDAVEEARVAFMGRLEQEAIRRAVQGVKEERIGPGGVIIEVTKYSDTLLLALLKANDPHKYGDKLHVEQSKTVNLRIGFGTLPTAARLKLLEALQLASPEIKDAEARLIESDAPNGTAPVPPTDVS